MEYDGRVVMGDAKVCTRCGVLKSLTDYTPNRAVKDGRGSRCKSCVSEVARARRAADPEKARQGFNRRVQARRERDPVAYAEKEREREKRKRSKHRSVLRERARSYYQQNRERYLERMRHRASVPKGSTPAWLNKSQKKAIRDVYEHARDCRAVSGQQYHVDHIIPLRHPLVCGLHVPWNLQVLPQDINDSKGNFFEGGWT